MRDGQECMAGTGIPMLWFSSGSESALTISPLFVTSGSAEADEHSGCRTTATALKKTQKDLSPDFQIPRKAQQTWQPCPHATVVPLLMMIGDDDDNRYLEILHTTSRMPQYTKV
ncbi:hypothetical protein CEXT_415421 [Caerostris extrusa]|uniref:Uncharacterized protein n=1 Tax=Caerostris extrusa TaxID=172846 RepID=A0AAV4US37_CAEEX|nr:hypothetical protein CEXT_415421 [Caerostris extrusa]